MKKQIHNIILYSLIMIILVLSVVIYNEMCDNVEEMNFRKMSIVSEDLVDTIDYWFIEQSISVIGAKGMLEATDSELVLKQKTNNPYLEVLEGERVTQMYLGLSDGSFYSSVDWQPGVGYDPRERIWYKMANESDGVIFTPHYIDAYSYDLIVTAAVSVIMDEDTKGVVAIDFKLDQLNELLKDYLVSSEHQIYIIDDEGEIISSNLKQSIGDSFDELFGDIAVLEPKEVHDLAYLDEKIIMAHSLPRTDWFLVIIQDQLTLSKQFNRIGLIIFSFAAAFVLAIGFVIIRIRKDYEDMKNKIDSLSGDRERILTILEDCENADREHQMNFRIMQSQLIYPLDSVLTKLDKALTVNDDRLHRDMIYTIEGLISRLEDVLSLDELKNSVTEEQVINVSNLVVWIKTTLTLYSEKMDASLIFTSGKNLPKEVLMDSLKTQSILIWLMGVLTLSACEKIQAQVIYSEGRLKLIVSSDQDIIIRDNNETFKIKMIIKQIGGRLTQVDEKTVSVSVPSIIYGVDGNVSKESMFNNLLDEAMDFSELDGKIAVVGYSKYNEHILRMVSKQFNINYVRYNKWSSDLKNYKVIFFELVRSTVENIETSDDQILIAIIEEPSVEVMTQLTDLNCAGYIEKPLSKDKVVEKLKMYFFEKEEE